MTLLLRHQVVYNSQQKNKQANSLITLSKWHTNVRIDYYYNKNVLYILFLSTSHKIWFYCRRRRRSEIVYRNPECSSSIQDSCVCICILVIILLFFCTYVALYQGHFVVFFFRSIYGIHGRTFVVYVTDRRYVRAYDDDMLKTTQRDINLLLLGVLFLSISSHTCLVFSWYQSIEELS